MKDKGKWVLVRDDSPEEFEVHPGELDNAVAQADAYAVLKLAEGEYFLEKPLKITKPLVFVGAGAEKTRLVVKKGDCVVKCQSKDTVRFEEIYFEYQDKQEMGSAVIVSRGRAEFFGCTARGGRNAGFLFQGYAKGILKNCLALTNGTGLLVRSRAEVQILGSICEENTNGIWIRDKAKVEAEQNICRKNKYRGIDVAGEAEATLKGNECEENEENGIWITDKAEVEAEENICRKNKYRGIDVDDEAEASLKGNECEENEESGIWIRDKAEVEAVENVCRKNKGWGIYIQKGAKVKLKDNLLLDNDKGDLFPSNRWERLLQFWK